MGTLFQNYQKHRHSPTERQLLVGLNNCFFGFFKVTRSLEIGLPGYGRDEANQRIWFVPLANALCVLAGSPSRAGVSDSN